MKEQAVGFIGLGVMGEPMCRNLRERSGKKVLAFDLNPEPLGRLAKHGVDVAGSAGEVVRGSSTVFVSLPSGKQLAALAHSEDGLFANVGAEQIVVDLGTSPVAGTRERSAEFAQ